MQLGGERKNGISFIFCKVLTVFSFDGGGGGKREGCLDGCIIKGRQGNDYSLT